MVQSSVALLAAIAAWIFSTIVGASSLEDVKHVVFFMQENRAFDHYYGTMAGVRGYKDPNVLKRKDGKPIWYQSAGNGKDLLPFHLTPNSSYSDSTQCLIAGSNDWTPNHKAWHNGSLDQWIIAQSPWAWGSLRRSDIPTHFSIVEGWTVADMYAESVIGPTGPNRVVWTSGTINVPGSPPGDPMKKGGPYIENWQTDGCQYHNGVPSSCYPLKWKTVPEYLEENDISWFLYEESDRFADNPFPWFENYQTTNKSDPLVVKSMSAVGLDKFYADAKQGKLPQVSYVVGPMDISEHPPFTPQAGAWFQNEVIQAVVNSPLYNNTVLIISYDETGGFGDHVPPFISPNGTSGEWFTNPENKYQYVPSGPGFRVPMYIISPWTTGGNVYTTPSDHNSQIKFLEKWAEESLKKNITTHEMNPWRRQHMSDLLDMFDFEHPNYTIPHIESIRLPSKKEAYSNNAVCVKSIFKKLPDGRCPVPYDNQTEASSLWTEEGYKQVRGSLTEGRYLVFKDKKSHKCITAGNSTNDDVAVLSECSKQYKAKNQRFVLHQEGDAFSKKFKIRNPQEGYLKSDLTFNSTFSEGEVFKVEFKGSKGYLFNTSSSLFSEKYYDVFSVTYNDEEE